MPDIFDTGERAAVADERTTLEAFLGFYRDAVKRKVRGVSEEDARKRLVESPTTLAGIVKHLARVEQSWFQHRLAQRPVEELPLVQRMFDDPETEWRVDAEDTVEQLLDAYDEECAASRETVARFEIDHVVPHPALGRVSLRWILVHMIEETARHAGHADIVREQIDGTTGE